MTDSDYSQLRGTPRVLPSECAGPDPWHAARGQSGMYQPCWVATPNFSQPILVHTILRTIATARIVLPDTIIRLSAGRQTLSETEQVRGSVLLIPSSHRNLSGDVLHGGCECRLHWRRDVDDPMLAVGRGMMIAPFSSRH
jgi:Biotin and Thiamin Synthesis associated domain